MVFSHKCGINKEQHFKLFSSELTIYGVYRQPLTCDHSFTYCEKINVECPVMHN